MTMRWVATVALTIIRRKEWHVMARHLLSRYAVCVPRHGDMPSWWHAQSVDFFGGKVIWVDPTNKRGLNKSYQFGPKLHWYETIETLPHPTLLEIMVKRCSQCEIHRESRSYKTGPTWRITSEYGNRTSEMFRYIYIYSTWAIMCDLIVPDMVLVRHQLICCSSCNSGSSCNVHDAAVWCSLKLRSMFYSTLDCTTWPYLIQANFVALSPQHTGFSFTQVNKNQNLHSHHQPSQKSSLSGGILFDSAFPVDVTVDQKSVRRGVSKGQTLRASRWSATCRCDVHAVFVVACQVQPWKNNTQLITSVLL